MNSEVFTILDVNLETAKHLHPTHAITVGCIQRFLIFFLPARFLYLDERRIFIKGLKAYFYSIIGAFDVIPFENNLLILDNLFDENRKGPRVICKLPRD